jgi:hypothetical protein
MKIKVVVHEAEEGGFWAEVPAIPGCATEGETMDSSCAICTKQSKAAFRSMWPSPSEAVKSGFSK